MSRKSVLITGANRGIGHVLALAMVDHDWTVYAGMRRPDDNPIPDRGRGEWVPLLLDVTDPETVRDATAYIAQRSGSLDALVNNAAVFLDEDRGGDVLDPAAADIIQRTFEVNFYGAMRMIQECLFLLERAAPARIVNVSSGLGQLHDMESMSPGYSLSKVALNGLTRQAAAALRSRRISVNSMCPGWCRTDMGGAGATRSAEEGADTIVWLLCQVAADLTGGFFRDRKSIGW